MVRTFGSISSGRWDAVSLLAEHSGTSPGRGMTRFDSEWLSDNGLRDSFPSPRSRIPTSRATRGCMSSFGRTMTGRPFDLQVPRGGSKGRIPPSTSPTCSGVGSPAHNCLMWGRPGPSLKRTLRKRLDEYRRFGKGEPIGHWGGRLIWQLADSDELVVGWRATKPPQHPQCEESTLIRGFEADYGMRPFANMLGGVKVCQDRGCDLDELC